MTLELTYREYKELVKKKDDLVDDHEMWVVKADYEIDRLSREIVSAPIRDLTDLYIKIKMAEHLWDYWDDYKEVSNILCSLVEAMPRLISGKHP